MSFSFWQMLAETPWWLHAFCCYVIYLGYLATKPRTILVKRLFSASVISLILSVLVFFSLVDFTVFNVITWIDAFALGCGLGWLHYRIIKVTAADDKTTLYLPGSWGVLIFILALLAAVGSYRYQFTLATQPSALHQHLSSMLAIYAFFTGLCGGRCFYSWRCVKASQ